MGCRNICPFGQDIPSASVITEHSTNFPEAITAQQIIALSTKKASQ